VAVDVYTGGEWREFGRAPAVGCRRLISGDTVTASKLRVRITDASACPTLSEIALYRK